jgi:hypothetical protein
VPKSVIYDFEAIEIDEQQCQLAIPLNSTLDCQLQPLDQSSRFGSPVSLS